MRRDVTFAGAPAARGGGGFWVGDHSMPDNVEPFRQIIERGFNWGDLSVAHEICATEFAEH